MADLLARPEVPGGLRVYRIADNRVQMGSSFGNAHCWLDTLGTGAVEQLFSTDIGHTVVSGVALRYSCTGVHPSFPEGEARVLLHQEGQGEFIFHPAFQVHRFSLESGLQVEETVWVPRTGDGRERPLVYLRTRIRNCSPECYPLRVSCYAQLHGETEPNLHADYDPAQGRLAAWNASQPNWVRVMGASAAPHSWDLTHNESAASEALQLVTPPQVDVGALIGALHLQIAVPAGTEHEIVFMLAFSPHGRAEAERFLAEADPVADLTATERFMAAQLSRSDLATPDPIINDGMYWAKANMLRVMHDYPLGPAFTNSPGNAVNIVVRDSAWFVLGCDYLRPEFSRALLDQIAARQERSGLIIEYWNAITGEQNDYGLNINDNTPLFMLAAGHHFNCQGDRGWLQQTYPSVARAARYILTQLDGQGLVSMTATGTDVYGIAGWRNIIPGYRINGAITEINAECVAALAVAGDLAEAVTSPEAADFHRASTDLRHAVNRYLLNPANGLYYLNIDLHGQPHSDVTADEVFPIVFGVADAEVAYRIINRLTAPDFSNEAGIRTVPRTSLHYHPYRASGLLGGVWPGVTWWCAYAAARYYSSFHVNALRASYRQYQLEPRKNNTVPGQFSEWFDGESMVNLGMRLSPWEPPRFVWAAIEGVCGACPAPEALHVNPRLPEDWTWLALRHLPYHGELVSYFAARLPSGLQLFSCHPLDSNHPVEIFDSDVTDQITTPNPEVHAFALRRGGEVLIALGNEALRPNAFVLNASPVAGKGTITIETYNSRDHRWTRQDRSCEELAVWLDQGGYVLMRLHTV